MTSGLTGTVVTGPARWPPGPHLPAETTSAQRDAVQRRTIGTLVAMQASGNAAIASVVAVSTLLAADLLGRRRPWPGSARPC